MIKHVFFCLMLMMSCNSANINSEQNQLPFDIILENATGGRTTEDIVIISDENALEEIYSGINANRDPGYQVPEIDFKSELVLVFFMGEKNTGGYNITVKSISEASNHINVYYKENSPKPTDMVTMAITQPYCIVKIKKPSKELNFLKVE